MKKLKEYALYKGDDLIAMGNKIQLAAKLGVKVRTIEFYTTPTYKRRAKGSFKRKALIEI